MLDMKDGLLKGDGTKFKRAAHAGDRLQGWSQLVVLSTGGNTIEGAVNWAQMPGSKFAPHFVIGNEGEVVQLLPLNERGCFSTEKEEEISIGVAVVNPGKLRQADSLEWIPMLTDLAFGADGRVIVDQNKNGWIPYNAAQVQTLLKLSALFRTINPDLRVLGQTWEASFDGALGVGKSVGSFDLFNGFSRVMKKLEDYS